MRYFDFSSWEAIGLSVAILLLLLTVLGMGIRLLSMMTLQRRRERQNRRINERLRMSEAASDKVSPAVERLHATSAKRWSKVYEALAK